MKQWYSTDNYFDISNFRHRDLFHGLQFVWQALDHLEKYILGQSLGHIDAKQQQYAYLINPELISIGEGTVIEPGAYIKGPCIIGKNCQIRHGAYIRGNVIVGDNCVVGHTTELKHSILLDHAKAAHFAFVGDSILGNDVNLGAGVKCANLRLDDAAVIICHGEESISTGRRKLGSIIGDKAQIGCNVVANPGTLFGKGVKCFPTMNVGGIFPHGSLIKPKSKNMALFCE